MKQIVITGANSFIGKAIIKLLSTTDSQVHAIVRNSSSLNDIKINNLTIHELEMSQYKSIAEAIKGIDVLVALAWNGTRGGLRNDTILQFQNYQYSMELIKSAIGLGCSKIILAGSQAEYGFAQGIITEDLKPEPETEYGKYKHKLYQNALRLCTLNNVALLEPRFFSVYGPGDNKQTLVASTIQKMIGGEVCEFSIATHLWNYLYVLDAADAILHMINQESITYGVYNVASNDTRALKEYIEEIKVITKSSSELRFGSLSNEPIRFSMNASIEKITSELGWFPKTSFKQGILEILGQQVLSE